MLLINFQSEAKYIPVNKFKKKHIQPRHYLNIIQFGQNLALFI